MRLRKLAWIISQPQIHWRSLEHLLGNHYNICGSKLYKQVVSSQMFYHLQDHGNVVNDHQPLQIRVGCFNHRVVTLVAYKLEGGYESSSCNHNTLTTLRTSVNESLQMHFKVTVRNFHVLNACRWFPYRCSESFQCVVVVRWTGHLPFRLPYAISL